MVVRLIDKSHRLGGSDITFDPAVDIAADGRMKLAKAEEYLMKNVQSLKFYEENGKVCFEGNVAEVPAGFENRISIDITFKQGTGLPVAAYNTIPYRAVINLPKVGPFKEEIMGISSYNQIRDIEIITSIDAIEHTNTAYGSYKYEGCWIFGPDNDNRIDAINCIKDSRETHKFYDLSTIFLWLSK
jgi:hypothetical protein